MKIHKSITVSRVMEAAEREAYGTDNPGFCLSCGEEQEGCEPDAEKYECESCGENWVYGAAQILLCGFYNSDKKKKEE